MAHTMDTMKRLASTLISETERTEGNGQGVCSRKACWREEGEKEYQRVVWRAIGRP